MRGGGRSRGTVHDDRQTGREEEESRRGRKRKEESGKIEGSGEKKE
jgi:hypothetical protein